MVFGGVGQDTEPAARTEELVVTESGDGDVIYDPSSHHIHHLNAVSTAIWRLCDGQRSVEEIAHAASVALGGEVSAGTVRIALGELAAAHLLVGAPGEATWAAGQSRRTFLRKAAAGAVAVPAVISISAPAAAQQVSRRVCGMCPVADVGQGCICDDETPGFCGETDGTTGYCVIFS